MAIVPNKDGQGIKANGAVGDIDRNYMTPNRTGSGVPAGTSQYASELMLDTVTGEQYRAMATGTTSWVKV